MTERSGGRFLTAPFPAGSELSTVVTAAVVWAGAALGLRFHEIDGPMIAVLATLAAAGLAAIVRVRRRAHRGVGVVTTICLGGTLALASSAWAQNRYLPLESGPMAAEAVIRSDPEPMGVGWRVEVQLVSGERLEATAFGSQGFVVRQLSVGQQVLVSGSIKEVGDRDWLKRRHIVGRLGIQTIDEVGEADGFNRLVNGIRQVVVDGSVGLDSRDQALYLGLVIGDDRFQHLSQKAQFRAAGLTHLLAVSGQNVAFVLLVLRPLLLLFGSRVRVGLVVVVLVLFVAVTRAEPSVLRAVAAAIVGIWATTTGRSRAGLRALAGGVTVMIFVDPFLVDVVGFQLSVAASVGIVILGPALAQRLPFPPVLAEPLAVTIAAQVAVSPLLVGYFGPLPLAAIPANLLAGWAAGAVMTVGLTIGPLVGLIESAQLSALAALVQWPTRLLVGWIDLAARWSASAPLPRLDGRSLALLVSVGVGLACRPRRGASSVVAASVGAAVISVVLANAMPNPPIGPIALGPGSFYLPGVGQRQAVLVVEADASTALLDELLSRNISNIDVVISERGDRSAARLITAVGDVAEVDVTLAPSLHRIQGATRVTSPVIVETHWGPINVLSVAETQRLQVDLPFRS